MSIAVRRTRALSSCTSWAIERSRASAAAKRVTQPSARMLRGESSAAADLETDLHRDALFGVGQSGSLQTRDLA
jgi:hypothetical protein